jgi:hypothetical protein
VTVRNSGHTFGEVKGLIAELVGWPPEDLARFVIVSIDRQGCAGFGASPGIKPQEIPGLLRAMAEGIELEVMS